MCSDTNQQDTIVTIFCCFERGCYHSDNFYGPWFVFITACEFDNTDMEGTPIEWRLSYRSISETVYKTCEISF